MRAAIEQAQKAFEIGEVPVGAVLVLDNEIIAKAHNMVESFQDASAHAEMLCLREASKKISNWRLLNSILYTTLEPCCMCLGAILLFRVKTLVWGAPDIRHGACGSYIDVLQIKHPTHALEVRSGVYQKEISDLIKSFFKKKRSLFSSFS